MESNLQLGLQPAHLPFDTGTFEARAFRTQVCLLRYSVADSGIIC